MQPRAPIVTSTLSSNDLEIIRNRTFDEIAVGDRASIERTLTASDIQLFAAMSGDINPTHIDPEYADSTRFHGVVAHGMWGAALISAVLGTRLPGPGTVYASQTLTFHAPIRVGDTLTIAVTVTARDEANHRLVLDCSCTNQDGRTVISGQATVIAPTERIERARGTLPQVRIALAQGDDLVRLLQYVRPLGKLTMAVVHPCDSVSLSAALDARAAGLIEPVLIGPRARILAVAEEVGVEDRRPRDRGRAAQPRGRGPRRRARAQRQGRRADEGQPAHRRADGRRGREPTAHRASHEPLLPHADAGVSAAVHHHRRRAQHRADARRQGGHRTQCGRPRARVRPRAPARRHPRGGRDHQSAHAGHARCGGAVQDGRPRPDRRRHPRRTARFRQRRVGRRRAHQGHRVRRRGLGRHPGGSRSRERQHAREAAHVPGRRGQRGNRRRGTRADRPHEPRGSARVAHRLLRGGACLARGSRRHAVARRAPPAIPAGSEA